MTCTLAPSDVVQVHHHQPDLVPINQAVAVIFAERCYTLIIPSAWRKETYEPTTIISHELVICISSSYLRPGPAIHLPRPPRFHNPNYSTINMLVLLVEFCFLDAGSSKLHIDMRTLPASVENLLLRLVRTTSFTTRLSYVGEGAE